MELYTPQKVDFTVFKFYIYIYMADVENQGNWSNCNILMTQHLFFFYPFSSSTLPAPMPQCT